MGEIVPFGKKYRPKKFNYPTDPATEYAHRVLQGEIIVGQFVRQECIYHLDELVTADETGMFWYDVDAAYFPINFAQDVCWIPRVAGDDVNLGPYKPFKLLEWQQFVAGRLWGWKKRRNNARRFTSHYGHMGKGSGKTPFYSMLCALGLLADNEPVPEIYLLAHDMQQAGIALRDLVGMINHSPDLQLMTHIYGGDVNPSKILNLDRDGFITRLAGATGGGKADGKSGSRPSIIFADEYHEHRSSENLEMMTQNFKQRSQPLRLVATNAGTRADTACGLEHHYALRVLRGEIPRDECYEYFPYVCALDPGDDPYTDPTCWPKANPALHEGLPDLETLERKVMRSRGFPSLRARTLRLNFCVWTGQSEPWIDYDAWVAAAKPLSNRVDRKKVPCWISVDLAFTVAFAAGAVVWEMDKDHIKKDPAKNKPHECEVRIWTPEETLADREREDSAEYTKWVEEEYLHTTPGKTIKMSAIAEWIVETVRKNNVQGIAYDNRFMKHLSDALDELGYKLVDDPAQHDPKKKRIYAVLHHQGPGRPRDSARKTTKRDLKNNRTSQLQRLYMPMSINEFETALIDERLTIKPNALLDWMAFGSHLKPSPQGDRSFDKTKGGYVDAIEALIMAYGFATAPRPDTKKGFTAEDLKYFTKPKSK